MSKVKNAAAAEVTGSSFHDAEKQVDPQAHYKCLRNPEDGSMYYGEVAYIRKSNGQIIK